MAVIELPQFYTYNQDLGRESPGKAFRTNADHGNKAELLSDLLAEVLTSFLNNPRGGSLFYGVDVEIKNVEQDSCNPVTCSAPPRQQQNDDICSCSLQGPRPGECRTDGVGVVKGIPESEADRTSLHRQLNNALQCIRPRVSLNCCSISFVPVMNTPTPYTTFYVIVFTVVPPPIPAIPYERITRDSAVEEHAKLTRKLSDLVIAVTELSNVFSQVYEPHYHATAVVDPGSYMHNDKEDPRCRLVSLPACSTMLESEPKNSEI